VEVVGAEFPVQVAGVVAAALGFLDQVEAVGAEFPVQVVGVAAAALGFLDQVEAVAAAAVAALEFLDQVEGVVPVAVGFFVVMKVVLMGDVWRQWPLILFELIQQ
jgi:ABC-type glucose/galactose transport system permease subunit